MQTYLVTATLKFPSIYNRGYDFEVIAKNAAEAIKIARRKVQDAGHTRQDGGLTYRAQKEGA